MNDDTVAIIKEESAVMKQVHTINELSYEEKRVLAALRTEKRAEVIALLKA